MTFPTIHRALRALPRDASDAQRTPQDYAIEHGRYLATAANAFMEEQNRAAREEDDPDSDVWRSLESAIYEFRKRADRVDAEPPTALPDRWRAIRIPGVIIAWLAVAGLLCAWCALFNPRLFPGVCQ